MPQIQKPSNDEARLDMLKKALATAASDHTNETYYLAVNTVTTVNTLATRFDAMLKSQMGRLAVRSKEIREKNAGMRNVEAYVRDMWESTKRRVQRNQEPAEVLTFYGLPLDGHVPTRIDENVLLELAGELVEGDKKAVAAGYPAATNPSAKELLDVLTSARKEFNDVAPADREYNISQENLGPVRAEVDEMIDDIIAELEFNLRKKQPSVQRRIMRTYGVTYTYAVGEPEEETKDTTTAADSNLSSK